MVNPFDDWEFRRFHMKWYVLKRGDEFRIVQCIYGTDPRDVVDEPGWEWGNGPHETEAEAETWLDLTQRGVTWRDGIL